MNVDLKHALLASALLGCLTVPAQAAQINAGDVPEVNASIIPPDPNTFLTLLEKAAVENDDSAIAYYKAIDPTDSKTTYADWLVENGFINSAADYPDTGPITFNPDVISVLHHNKVDLNFTRFLSVRCEPSCDAPNPDIYSTIENYPDFESAKTRTNRIASVTMEWTSAPDGSNPGTKFTTFYSFVATGTRNDPATGGHLPFAPNLDGRGKKPMVGLCTTCHGGIPGNLNPDGTYPNNGNIGARFIPMDLDNFKFDSAPGFTRVDQEAKYKALNKIVLITHQANIKTLDEAAGFKRFPAGKDLIEGWYGGPGMPNDTFDGQYVPKGWKGANVPAGTKQFYLKSVAPACRACHAQREMALDFGTYENFMTFKDAHLNLVLRHECNKDNDPAGVGTDSQGIMPLALVTYARFWGLEEVDETTGETTVGRQAKLFKKNVGTFTCPK